MIVSESLVVVNMLESDRDMRLEKKCAGMDSSLDDNRNVGEKNGRT